ncbi:hypothetical protein QAD02_016873 [Eretmocerus hayati]|uniref:Uncharacterized protein n=1 Tax=Eretmocerus hayati TaxID=131215 RepID=A0ACC2PE42_9HYME|nr:hypothetical protein QAD02_016873 [Eretmocerus hayati]
MQRLLIFVVSIRTIFCLRWDNVTIWNEMSSKFVTTPIARVWKGLSIETEGEINKIGDVYDFGGRALYLLTSNTSGVFYHLPNDNTPKGIIGDLWVVLSNLLNFTIIMEEPKIIPSDYYDCINLDGLLRKKCKITGVSGVSYALSRERDFIQCYFRDKYFDN